MLSLSILQECRKDVVAIIIYNIMYKVMNG